MKHLTIRFIVALLTFLMGVTLVSVWLIHRYNQVRKVESKINIEQSIPADTFITLERKGCYGTCPIYSVAISGDGSVVFHAIRYWIRKDNMDYPKGSGPIKVSINQNEVRQLISEFERINHLSIKDECGVRDAKESQGYSKDYYCAKCSTDMASATTSITINGKSKSIEHYYGCEGTDTLKNLTTLERRIDEILNTKQWMQ